MMYFIDVLSKTSHTKGGINVAKYKRSKKLMIRRDRKKREKKERIISKTLKTLEIIYTLLIGEAVKLLAKYLSDLF